MRFLRGNRRKLWMHGGPNRLGGFFPHRKLISSCSVATQTRRDRVGPGPRWPAEAEFDLPFPLVRANGEQPPFADASFDLVVSEYGHRFAAIPIDGFPRRPGSPTRRTPRLPGQLGVDDGFHISYGDMIKARRALGFDILHLVELYAEPDLATPYPFLQGDWATRWPAEEIWVADKPRDNTETPGL